QGLPGLARFRLADKRFNSRIVSGNAAVDRPSAKARGAEKPTAGMGLVANRGPMAPQGLEHFLRDIFGAAAFVQEARRSAHGAGPTVLKDTLERFRLHQLLQPPRSQGSGSRLHGSAYRCKRMCSRGRSYIER